MKWYVDILKKYRCFNGRSQRWEFWMFQFTNYLIIIPLIGPIVVLIFLVSDSERQDNIYGPSPKYSYNN
ncbi:MAG: hypothetical protein N4A63_09490 [Vallitalea sp.]|jgi:uncharacterized membrane protein YhaH (DUF805 family)|nr:hypothetical protein [Vallitalea sp.]